MLTFFCAFRNAYVILTLTSEQFTLYKLAKLSDLQLSVFVFRRFSVQPVGRSGEQLWSGRGRVASSPESSLSRNESPERQQSSSQVSCSFPNFDGLSEIIVVEVSTYFRCFLKCANYYQSKDSALKIVQIWNFMKKYQI